MAPANRGLGYATPRTVTHRNRFFSNPNKQSAVIGQYTGSTMDDAAHGVLEAWNPLGMGPHADETASESSTDLGMSLALPNGEEACTIRTTIRAPLGDLVIIGVAPHEGGTVILVLRIVAH